MRRAAILAALLAAGCLRARGTADEPVITGIDLQGVQAVDPDELRDALATQASSPLPWTPASRLDPDALAIDRQRILAFYRAHGRYAAAVDAVEILPDGEGRARIVVRIREGPPVRVSQLSIVGLEGAPEARARLGKLSLAPGDVFTDAAYDAARAELAAALHGNGYPDALVTQEAHVYPDAGTVEVRYTVVPGARYRFGRIQVRGVGAETGARIEDQAAIEIRPGEPVDDRAVARAKARIFNLGVFSGVRVTLGALDPETGTVPVLVAVREAPFRTFRVGPGIGFETLRWEAQGLASWSDRNFFGDLRKLEIDLRAGYAWLPDPLSPIQEGPVGLLAVEFTQPAAITREIDLTLRAEAERSLEPGYGYWAERFRVGAPLRLASRWTVAPSYNLEFYQLENVNVASGLVPPQLQNCPGRLCLLSYLEQRVAWDGRDDPLNTRQGIYLSLAVQEGIRVAGIGYRYVSAQPEARFYLPLGQRTVLAGGARVGAIVPIGEKGPMPIVGLYTGGGPRSMRGYGIERLSPMVFQYGQWIPTGGNGIFEGSLELRRALVGDLGGAVFVDAGDVSNASGRPTEWLGALDPSLIQYAVGFGIRYRTPFGPFRADLGFRLPTDFRPGVPFYERFPKVPGGADHREPIVAFHVTLGEAY